MTDLNRLADLVRGCDMLDADRDYLATLLRSAAAETVGTVWANHPDGKLMCNAFADATHNRDLSACRLALAAARKERDEAVAECERHRNDAFREADACRTITAERAALQRAIDEAIIFVEGHLTDENRRKLLAATLRPHATPSQPERAKAEPKTGKEYLDAIGCEAAGSFVVQKEPAASLYQRVSEQLARAYAKHGRDPWGRHEFYGILKEEVDELWEAIKSDASQSELMAELEQIMCVCQRYVETGDRYRGPHDPTANGWTSSVRVESLSVRDLNTDAPASRPCDCRELVARLTECVEALASRRVFPHFLRDIIRDARGGGA